MPEDFYVGDGECMACGAPPLAAPRLVVCEPSCRFTRQPASVDDVDAAIRALWMSCCGALRYRGDDPEILRRLHELDLGGCCEVRLPIAPRTRTRARLTWASSTDLLEQVAARLGDAYQIERASGRLLLRWADAHRAEVAITPAPAPPRWSIAVDGSVGIAMELDQILRDGEEVSDLRWYAPDDEPHPERWTARPY